MIIYLMIAVLLAVLFLIWQDNGLKVTRYSLKNKKIPADFDGFKIVQISDFHNKYFGRNQRRILNKIRVQSPDIIVVTGDLIDRRRYHPDRGMALLTGMKKIAPVYYVSGNHETMSGKYEEIIPQVKKTGVTLLENVKCEILSGNSTIKIAGNKNSEAFSVNYLAKRDISEHENRLKSFGDSEKFTILLSHRPELFPVYCNKNIDLVFCGHAHGGQFRLPFIGGLYAPDQGIFPPYTSGIHTDGDTSMVVSRGIGNSLFPIRLFNRPEIVVMTLKSTRLL